MNKPHLVLLFLIAIVSSCHFPKIIPVKLKRNFTDISNELKTGNNFEDIQIRTNEGFAHGHPTPSLILDLTNGKNLPPIGNDLMNVAKEKMSILLDNVENRSAYGWLQVNFITKKSSPFGSTTDKMGYSFSPEDFQK